jgi:hypothetical protein
MPSRVLVVLCGLLRTYQLTWPVLQKQLRLTELDADVVVLTSLLAGSW